jgi:NAD dependent epimerase/dehydratase family enzyme
VGRKTLGPWTKELEAADVIINLAGRSVNCRYQLRNRREILKSRVDSVRSIGRRHSRDEESATRVVASKHGDDLRPSF